MSKPTSHTLTETQTAAILAAGAAGDLNCDPRALIARVNALGGSVLSESQQREIDEANEVSSRNVDRWVANKRAATARRRCKHKATMVTSKPGDTASRIETCAGCNSIRVVSRDGSEVFADWYWL